MLGVCPMLRVIGALANSLQLLRHFIDLPGEVCQLACDKRCVLVGCHRASAEVYFPKSSGRREVCGADQVILEALGRLGLVALEQGRYASVMYADECPT